MDVEKLATAIRKAREEAESVGLDRITAPFKETDMILYYLELLKPRVLTLDEALGSDDPVYFESNGRMECWVDAYISDDLQCAVFYRFRATEFMLPLSRYKKDWRCWSSPPSYEQSKAVKWE